MNEIILLKYGEIALKGLNKNVFEDILLRNIRWRMRDLGSIRLRKAQSTVYLEPEDASSFDFDEALDRASKIFGLAAVSRALVTEKTMEALSAQAPSYLEETLSSARTFKVETRRADKHFPLKSPQISAEIGGVLLDAFPHLTVDVHNPDVVVHVEIRDFGAYIHAGSIPGAGGMPVSSSGRAMIFLTFKLVMDLRRCFIDQKETSAEQDQVPSGEVVSTWASTSPTLPAICWATPCQFPCTARPSTSWATAAN